jgi:Mrp family chromosome partitioning ATPase
MASLISDFSHAYEFVIIDTPPLLLAADAMTLSRVTDGILLVARPGIIDANRACAARDLLNVSHCNVLGLIVNGVIDNNEPNNNFYSPQTYFTPEIIPKKQQIKVF